MKELKKKAQKGRKLPIVEVFEGLQGEGPYVGCPSLFIRFGGCPVHCEFCDTKYSWEEGKLEGQLWQESDLIDKLFETEVDDIVLTGGEPLLYYQAISDWVLPLRMLGKRVFMETSGVFGVEEKALYQNRDVLARLLQHMTWIMSPKSCVDIEKYHWIKNVRFDDIYFKFVWEGDEKTKWFINEFFEYIEKPLYEKIEEHTVFVMPQGKLREEVLGCAKDVWGFCQRFKLRYSPREHIIVWGNRREK